MATITVRNLAPSIKERLRVRAAEHCRSVEAEVRRILQMAVEESAKPAEGNLYERIRARLQPLGGVELELPPGGPGREPLRCS